MAFPRHFPPIWAARAAVKSVASPFGLGLHVDLPTTDYLEVLLHIRILKNYSKNTERILNLKILARDVKQLFVKQLLTQDFSSRVVKTKQLLTQGAAGAEIFLLPWLTSDLLSNFLGQGQQSCLELSNSLGLAYTPSYRYR